MKSNDTISVIENLVFVYENLNILNNEFIREHLDFAIKSIKNMEKEFAAYKQAKSDGRLVVLREPLIPLVCSDDMTDSDVYCPKCGETLSGGWEKADADCSLKLFQCFHCGQSIDDSRAITREAAEAALAEMEEMEDG